MHLLIFFLFFQWYKKSGVDAFSLKNLAYIEIDTKQKLRQKRLYERLNEKVEDFVKQNRVNEETVVSEDEDSKDNVDVIFSVEGIREKSFHTTPDGEKVPMKALLHFMQQLRGGLPEADLNRKKPVKHNVGLLRPQILQGASILAL